MAQTIEAAAAALVLRPADYMLVEEALAMVPQDLSVYTKESVAALTDAVETVPRGQTVLNQAEVDLAAHAIEQAVIGLIPLEGGLKINLPISRKAKNVRKQEILISCRFLFHCCFPPACF